MRGGDEYDDVLEGMEAMTQEAKKINIEYGSPTNSPTGSLDGREKRQTLTRNSEGKLVPDSQGGKRRTKKTRNSKKHKKSKTHKKRSHKKRSHKKRT